MSRTRKRTSIRMSNLKGKPLRLSTIRKNFNAQVEKDRCKWCKKHGHYQRDYLDFLKSLLKRGEDFITFIDESLYLSYAKIYLMD